jgi:hypothetical protein
MGSSAARTSGAKKNATAMNPAASRKHAANCMAHPPIKTSPTANLD